MTLSLDLLLSLLHANGPQSAYDAARALLCRPEQICALSNEHWWDIQKVAGPEGFLYMLRPVVCATKRPKREVGNFDNTGIVMRSVGYSP